jgi:hypothetical protein
MKPKSLIDIMEPVDDKELQRRAKDTIPEMLYEKTNNIIYEISCLSVNMLQVNKKEELISEIQNTIRNLSGLLIELNNEDKG